MAAIDPFKKLASQVNVSFSFDHVFDFIYKVEDQLREKREIQLAANILKNKHVSLKNKGTMAQYDGERTATENSVLDSEYTSSWLASISRMKNRSKREETHILSDSNHVSRVNVGSEKVVRRDTQELSSKAERKTVRTMVN